jgi:hypothetical protein
MTTTPPLADIPVRSAAELTRRWLRVLDPPVFGARSLWLLWLGADGRMLPLVLPVDDVPPVPDRPVLRGLLDLHDAVGMQADGVRHLAMALCRPGHPAVTSDERAWVDALRATLDGELAGTWSLHLAAGGRVVPLVEAPEAAWPHG